MRYLLDALAVSGAVFWLYVTCKFAVAVGNGRRARGNAAQAQASAAESLNVAQADLAEQRAKREREAAEQRELINRVFADSNANVAKLAEVAANAAASLKNDR